MVSCLPITVALLRIHACRPSKLSKIKRRFPVLINCKTYIIRILFCDSPQSEKTAVKEQSRTLRATSAPYQSAVSRLRPCLYEVVRVLVEGINQCEKQGAHRGTHDVGPLCGVSGMTADGEARRFSAPVGYFNHAFTSSSFRNMSSSTVLFLLHTGQ